MQAVEDVCVDPAIVFPYSNRLNGSRTTMMREESEKWDLFFDPQHTFECFTHNLAKPATGTYYYNGKWPLDSEDILGMAPRHVKKARNTIIEDDCSTISVTEEDTFLIPSVPEPTLPNMEYLKKMGSIDDKSRNINTDTVNVKRGSMIQIDILPCPSNTLHTKEINEIMWKERMGLLNALQQLVFNENQDGTHDSPFEESRAARIQRHIKDKAEKLKKEAHVGKKFYESRDSMTNDDMKDVKLRDSFASFRELQEKNMDIDSIESQEEKQSNRQSFYLFLLGFLFPPLWMLNFILGFKKSEHQTEASKDIDKKWRKYSRNAFCISIFVCAVSLIIIVVTRPESVGFRQNTKGYQHSDVILFG